MKIADVMTRDVATVSPSTSLRETARLLVRRHISGLPVVDGTRVVGVVSERDLLFKEQQPPERSRWLAWALDPMAVTDRPKLEARTAGEAMTSPPLTIASSSTVNLAAKTMLGAGVSRLPVVDAGKLVGIVTRADLVRAFVRSDGDIAREIEDDVVVRTLWLDGNAVKIDVHDGEVTLSGHVSEKIDAQLLERLVRRIPGVLDVRSELEVA
jgi:CBS domain-containing protein